MVNDLGIGTVRIGDLIDFDPDTPDKNVQLSRTADSITLTIPWNHANDVYAKWFSPEVLLSRGDREEADRLPSVLMFVDHNGPVTLVGCRVSHLSPVFFGPGLGIITAKYAVLGAWGLSHLEEVNSLRTEVTGLRIWAGLSSVGWQDTSPSPGALSRTVKYTLHDGDPIDIGGPSRLRFVSGWSATNDFFSDDTVLRDFAKVETSLPDPVVWSRHLDIHYAIRDLLTISSWAIEAVIPEAVFKVDPVAADEDSAPSGSWYQVVAAARADDEPTPGPRLHLIKYLDLGPSGVLRWLSLRQEFARAIDPIVVSALSQDRRIAIELSQVCMGMEALAYLVVLRDDGISRKDAANMSIAGRLERIGRPLADIVSFDISEWADSTAKAYNAIKHANRTLHSDLDMLNRWRETVLIFRLWLASELGVHHQSLIHRLATDSMNEPYRIL